MIEHVRRSMDRGPKVKRRFNLLREEPPPPLMRQGLAVLAFLVLVVCVALVGTWKPLREKPGHHDALFNLSSIYMEQSAYAEAYPLIMELLRLNPGDPEGLANLAISEIALGRPEQAIVHLDEALTLEDPPEFNICFHQGVARSKLHRLEEAITWYRKAENLDPGHKHLLFNMAVTFDRLERYSEALDCYARFLKAGESSPPRERRDVETRVGVLMAYLDEAPKAPSAEGNHRHTEQEK